MHLLLISLLVASVGAYVPSMFKDPASFVAGLANANPATIKKMEDMVNELIAVGQGEKNARIGEYEEAVGEFDSATLDHADAKKGEETAAGAAAVQKSIWEAKTKKEALAADVLLDRTNTLNAKQTDFDQKDATMKSENIRISNERAYLDKVLPLLESLLPGVSLIEGKLQVVDYIVGRALLGTDLAAPDAVRRIVDKVNALIGKGESERNKANRDQENAEKALTKAVEGHAKATDRHTAAAGELGQATNELDRLTRVLNVKSQELTDAVETLAEKKSVMDSRKATMDEEVARLDMEDATMREVLVLLANLNNE